MPASSPTPTVSATQLTDYERVQQFNALTRWLHSFRYRNLTELMTDLRREIPDRPIRVLEVGSAVSKIYGVLDPLFPIEYSGVELDPNFVKVAHERYGNRPNFRSVCVSASEPGSIEQFGQPDIVCALETMEHIPEHDVVRIVERIAAMRPRRFICSVPVEVGPALWIKNGGSFLMGYARAKNRPWREVFWGGLYQLDKLPPHGTGHGGFDWRWLAQTIRHNMRIRQIRRSPFPWVPTPFAFSVMFVAEPWPARRNS